MADPITRTLSARLFEALRPRCRIFFMIIAALCAGFGEIALPERSFAGTAGNDYKYEREYLQRNLDGFIAIHGDLTIKEIRINGLSRTRRGHVLGHSASGPGRPVSTFDPHGFVNRLTRRNIFSDIDIAYAAEDGMAVILIDVKEKWTLIPLPFYYSNSNNTSYGFFLIESNLLGYGKSLFLGGAASSLGWSGSIGYFDPEIMSTNFRMSIFLSYKNSLYRNGDIHGNVYREYRSREQFARLDLGYAFTEHFSLFLSGARRRILTEMDSGAKFNIPDSQEEASGAVIADVRDLVFFEYFYYGLWGRLEASRHFPTDEASVGYGTLEARLGYAKRVLSYNRVSLFLEGFLCDAPEIALYRIGGKPGSRILPAEIIVSRRHASATVSWERPVLRYSWGAVTLLAFWEQGVFDDGSTGHSFYGPGAGVLVYLKRVAFPAVSFNYAVNLPTRGGEFSAAIGFSL